MPQPEEWAQRRRAWIRAVSAAAILLLLSACAYGFLVMVALAAIVPVVIVWPLIVMLSVGLGAAIAGLGLALRQPLLRTATVVNLVASVGHATGLVLLGIPLVTAVE